MYKIVNGIETELTEDEILEFHEQEEKHERYVTSLEYRQLVAVSKRIYPLIQEQLDMIYHDKINNTNKWVEIISIVKSANPKPTE